MRGYTFLIAAATARIAVAAPQSIDFAAVNNASPATELGAPVLGVEDVPDYSPAEAASSAAAGASETPVAAQNEKRAVSSSSACAPQPSGYAPATAPDTTKAFAANKNYTSIAVNAAVPQGYQQVFQNLNGATQQAGYQGYCSYTLTSYDTVKCQEYCDAAAGCTAFNIYIERQPTLLPARKCENPPSTSAYKCSLYGLPISNATATNVGQYMRKFHVLIAASNGYVKNAPPAAQTNFDGPGAVGGAIQAPSGDTSYIGMRMFPGTYDPGQCAAVCTSTTQYDSEHLVRADGTYDACNFFNAYVLSENNSPLGTYCMFFTKPWGASYGTNFGQYDNDGNYYSVSSSYGYTLDPQDPGVVASPPSSGGTSGSS